MTPELTAKIEAIKAGLVGVTADPLSRCDPSTIRELITALEAASQRANKAEAANAAFKNEINNSVINKRSMMTIALRDAKIAWLEAMLADLIEHAALAESTHSSIREKPE